ncbi:MAG: MoxR family ATPase [Planctomycetota bacterium]|nr:MAG: MoxR family ATPase [Planctomycetota bacterium]
MNEVHAIARKIIGNVEKVIVGKRQQIVYALVAMFCEGHILLEDVPGVAKTMLARALAQSTGCTFKRIQCTPDLLPNDVTGASVFHPKTTEFEFRPGPIFAQIVLADEINRATPRTQSALLEAMAEGRVTVDGTTHVLESPFIVIATQNPVEHEGTFPLPEAQCDRFLMRYAVGYPAPAEELQMLSMLEKRHPIEDVKPVVSPKEIIDVQRRIRSVYVDEKVRQYIVDIVNATREHEDLALGGSPRATIALFRAAQALAAIFGRNYVLPDDVKRLLFPILNHRLILKPESRLRKMTVERVLEEVTDVVRVPVVEGPGFAAE